MALNVPNVPPDNIEKAMTKYLVIAKSVKRDCTKVNLVKVHAFLAYLASTQRPKERVNANYVLPIPFLRKWRHKNVKNVTKTRVNFHLKVPRHGTYIFTTR